MVGAFLDGPTGRARTVARRCALPAGVVGEVSFLAGFIGPTFFQPDAPQGPLGALAGAVVGVFIGLVAPVGQRTGP
jgi:hypothetical protein